MTQEEPSGSLPSRRRAPAPRVLLATAAAAVVAAGTVVAVILAASGGGSTPGVATHTARPTDGAGRPLTRDDALRRQLASDRAVRREMLVRAEPRGTMLCGVDVLGGDTAAGELYVWVACGDFTTGPEAALLSGTSEPAVVSVTGSGPDLRVVGVEFPHQQSLGADITRMFPPAVAEQLRVGDMEVSPTIEELLVLARRTGD